MTDFEIPNFGELLAEHRGAVPTEAYPYLVSRLIDIGAGLKICRNMLKGCSPAMREKMKSLAG